MDTVSLLSPMVKNTPVNGSKADITSTVSLPVPIEEFRKEFGKSVSFNTLKNYKGKKHNVPILHQSSLKNLIRKLKMESLIVEIECRDEIFNTYRLATDGNEFCAARSNHGNLNVVHVGEAHFVSFGE